MPKNSTPKLRRHKSSGHAYARFDGHQIWFGRHDDPRSHQEFAEYFHRWKTGDSKPLERDASTTTVAVLVARYLDHATIYYRRAGGMPTGTVDAIRYAVRPLLQLFASVPTLSFTVQSLKLVRDRMVQSGLARNTVNSRVGRIVHMFRWGCEEALVSATVYHELRVLMPLQRGRSKARETEPRRPVGREHVDAILPHVSRQIAGIVELMWWSGMRPSEALALRPADIDTTGDVWDYKLVHHKTLHHGKERTVPLGPKAQDVLRPFLMRVPIPDPELPLFSASEAEAERNEQRRRNRVTPMKPSDARRKEKRAERIGGRKVGQGYTVGSLRRAVARACKKAEIPHWTPHQLRHAAATRIRQEAGVEAASLALGHSNLVTTEIYAEASRERTRQIMRDLG